MDINEQAYKELEKQQASKEQQQAAEEKQRSQNEMKNALLSQVMDQNARARLNNIAIAKPEKAQMIENLVIQMAQRGQISSKLNETALKDLLEQVSQQTVKKQTKVVFDRRRANLDSDDSDDY